MDGKSYRFMGKEETPLKEIIPTAATLSWDAAYTESKPGGDWTSVAFDDRSWKKAKAAFGTDGMPNLTTPWLSKDIWIRRNFELTENFASVPVYLEYSHDDIFELYINGIEVVSTEYTWKNNVMVELSDEVKAALKPGKNIITAHCHMLQLGFTVTKPRSVPRRLRCAAITSACAALISGIIMGTSGVQRLALLLLTTGTSARA